jgi:formylglycine-generating enzyme required for sulfatase activity
VDIEIASTERTEPAIDLSTEMVRIPGGTFRMGSDRHYAEEAPAHNVRVNGFWIDRYAVTNEDFSRFRFDRLCDIGRTPG